MTPAPRDSAVEVVEAAVERLRDARVPTETRVATVRGAFGRVKVQPVGEVWRVGALCLASNGAVFATGDVLIVAEPTHPNHRNALAVQRNEQRLRLRRAGIAVGTTVVWDARSLDLDDPEPPLVVTSGGLGVLWATGVIPVPLAAYLNERVDLLIRPAATE